ncbi:DUF5985 family protein [Bosea sp. (in: a-proteobacteria)]|uniref:DUF5985 family protein n=1 Tax=Bosea sp. (in: a-proteobacteria) TaxID=1871050 RepID=UPI002735AB5E|nr:DUF5985 family protein [Bosea sp. (in: a-proteobacteria)]MDP3406702.1 DUF5985 family protein [Bosea sp. (in: a-proteobacteria)]
MIHFTAGLITMGFLVASLFFVKFWRKTRDILFLAFAAAFFLLAANQALTVLIDIPRDEKSYLYILRLIAFSIIIVSILQKNYKTPSKDNRK